MRSAQNLASLLIDIATGAAEWDQAEQLYQHYIPIATSIDAADRELIQANYIDLLIIRGNYATAHQMFEQVKLVPTTDDDVRLLFLINRAHLALAESNSEQFLQYLDNARSLAEEAANDTDRSEWVQLACIAQLRLGLPLPEFPPEWVEASEPESEDMLANQAERQFARAFIALVHRQEAAALEPLTETARLWSNVNYLYRCAVVSYWKAFAHYRLGNMPSALQTVKDVVEMVRPFGDVPLAHQAAALLAQLSEEDAR